jgi:hypothetical protein
LTENRAASLPVKIVATKLSLWASTPHPLLIVTNYIPIVDDNVARSLLVIQLDTLPPRLEAYSSKRIEAQTPLSPEVETKTENAH